MNPKRLVRDGYDKASHAYRADSGSGCGHDYEAWLEQLCADLGPRSHVLDLGCGCGLLVAQLRAARAEVTGVDISPVQIERARSLVPQARFLCEDMAAVAFPPASFDAVIAFFAVFHLPLEEQPAFFRRIAAWLKPGGRFLGTVGASAAAGMVRDWLGVQGANMYWSQTDARTYRRWLEECGFTVLRDEFVPEKNVGHQLFYAQLVS